MTFVAEKGTIFYKNNGMSNLKNIKDTKLYDILLWASEQKDHEEFINEYYDSLNKSQNSLLKNPCTAKQQPWFGT